MANNVDPRHLSSYELPSLFGQLLDALGYVVVTDYDEDDYGEYISGYHLEKKA